jgi:energy-coupling factor transporter ATP-binding protein EcfA2
VAIVFQPNDRMSIVGKSGSGKTTHAVVLASALVPYDDPEWEAWWVDSNQKPDDLRMLGEWGFGTTRARKLFKLTPDKGAIELQAMAICQAAMRRRNVLIIIDEYKHVTFSARRAGPGIEGVHLRGRGLNVGMIGLTQEPVDIPRQLLSQANHLFLFDVHYPADIKYIRGLYDGYERPPTVTVGGRDRKIGFYHCYIDGDAEWRYFPSVKQWHDRVKGLTTPGGVDITALASA